MWQQVGFQENTVCRKAPFFPQPVVEFAWKNDDLGDPMMNESQILAFGLATKSELETMTETALGINALLITLFAKIGIRFVDFKVEFGRYNGELILCDEISPDSCRLWDVKTGEKLDKDRFREDLGDLREGYSVVLERLQEQGAV